MVQSWDVAMTTGDANDYSVCTTWLMTKGDYYLLDVFRDRLSYPDLRRKVSSARATFKAQTILIEERAPAWRCCRTSAETCRRAWSARSARSQKAAKRIAWWRSRPRSRPGMSPA